MKKNLKMVNLHSQYSKIKNEVDAAIHHVIEKTNFINGRDVEEFASNLKHYLQVKYVIPCANGTDALQIAYMALGLQPGDEVIMPSFNYVASAEAATLLSLKPVFVDVHEGTFNLDEHKIEEKISDKTKAIVAVHLFGQSANMQQIMHIAKKHNLWVIEDNAQALGAKYLHKGIEVKTGTTGHINTTSFFPTKNLGCFGDGGAIMTNDDQLAETSRILTKHGQKQKYFYSRVGCNSRLDTLQAAILNVKIKYLDEFNRKRQEAATRYDRLLHDFPKIITPSRSDFSSHVFHQYVIKVEPSQRDRIQEELSKSGIPSLIYYPAPLHLQEAYLYLKENNESIPISTKLCNEVLALPMHTELDSEEQEYIVSTLKKIIN